MRTKFVTDEDGNETEIIVNDCGYQCFVIGGPFITTDPDCPKCNHNPDDHDGCEFCEPEDVD